MLVMEKRAVDGPDLQGAYFDGSLELLRELAVTNNVDAALPRLSAIVSKMLPHDALRMACFDQRGRPTVNASTADVPDMTAPEVDEMIIDDHVLALERQHVGHVGGRRVHDGSPGLIEARHAQGIVRQHLAHDRGEPW